jgi:hypothetical protein
MEHARLKALFSFLLILLFLGTAASQQKRPIGEIPEDTKDELVGYLKTHWMTPDDYVLSKFDKFDIIFIGEHHFIKHDVEFMQGLIPLLYKIGVTHLGIEFGCYELQDQVDSLLTADIYDEDLARHIMFQWGTYWPYVEYLGLYRKAWELNKTLPKDAPKFRIIGLDYRARWNLLTENMPSRYWKDILFKGPRNEHMAKVIQREFIKKNRKALIYTGQHHAFTRYNEPEYDFKKKKLIGLEKKGMGNIIYRKIPERVFNICLHYPWETTEAKGLHDYPVDGAIDRIMKEFETKRVGFDVVGSPFGNLDDPDAVYSAGRKIFAFRDFCDGYIFQKHFRDYEGCTVDPLFITEENLKEAIAYLPRASIKKKIKTRAQFLHKTKWDADIRRLYPYLESP